jgi:hypothetical protein
MPPAVAKTHLERARSGIRQALAGWDAADLQRVQSSCQLLAAAAGDLRQFESAVRSGEVPATSELCSAILAVKKEVIEATRVVDACVAFHRGLAARTGGAPPVYNAEGCIAEESAGLESEVHA